MADIIMGGERVKIKRLDGMKFFNGQKQITKTLENILIKDGSLGAYDAARETFFEYQQAEEKGLFDYGIMVGALEWMNAQDGRRSS